jgi:hypothetical protein
MISSSPKLSAAFSATSSPALHSGSSSGAAGNKMPTVIQQNPRFEAQLQLAAAPPNMTVQTVVGSGVTSGSLGMGGMGSQIRAMQQHIPPNTRLLRGPNGQVTVQKVQTIELSQEMQQVGISTGNTTDT